jgi:two-component system, OmpR family, response regulator CpxR
VLPLLLVITAARDISQPLRHELSAAGFKAYYVETLGAALGVVTQWQFDAVLLHGQGFDGVTSAMLSRLRDDVGVPILFVLDRGDEERQLQALDAGASQVLVEPTSMRVVAAQLRRLIDVSQQHLKQESAEVRCGPLQLDPRRAAASIGATPLPLTGGEFELLLLLASRPGELVHRETIARTLGRPSSTETRRSADMHICRIRRKLREVSGHHLRVETVYGRGYSLRLAGPAAESEALPLAAWSV